MNLYRSYSFYSQVFDSMPSHVTITTCAEDYWGSWKAEVGSVAVVDSPSEGS